MKDYFTHYFHSSEKKYADLSSIWEDKPGTRTDMDRQLISMLGTKEITIPNHVLQKLFFRLRLLSQKNKN